MMNCSPARNLARPATKLCPFFFLALALLLLPSESGAIKMKGRVAFSGGVGGEVSHYPDRYFYSPYGYFPNGKGYSYYFPDEDCEGDACANRGGIIRFWGTAGLESDGKERAELLGGSLSMQRAGTRRNAFGKYTGKIFAVFRSNGQEYLRTGTVSVRLKRNVLRTPFGRLKLARRLHDYPLRQKQLFRGHGRIEVNVWLP